MPDFSSWEELCAAIDSCCKDILLNDVASVAKDILKKHIETDIYGAYSPKSGGWFAGVLYETPYSRRHALEGAIEAIMDDPNTMTITSSASANQSLVPGYSFSNRYPGAFLQMLENGNMGIWRKGFSRPAVKNTQKEIDSSSKIQRAIKEGIKRVIS